MRYELTQNKKQAKYKFLTTGYRLLGGMLTLLALVACNKAGSPPPPAQEAAAAMPVTMITAKSQVLPGSLEAVGQAEGSLEVEVRARVSGLLERKLYEEGQKLTAGTPMFMIERAPYEIALQQAKAVLSQRQAQLEQAHREVQRLRPLAQDRAIPQREYDDAITNERLADASLAAAKASIHDAELNLSYTLIKAPISGVTGRSLKSQGSLVTAGADSLLGTITKTNPIWVRFSLSEAELARVHKSHKPEVRLLSDDGKISLNGGRMNFAGSTVDTKTGSVQMRAEFSNPEQRVLSGQYVRVQVLTEKVAAYKVPQSAVIQNEQGRMVWVARAGKAVQVPVETGAWIGSDWVIHKGLSDGDQVIIDNLIKLSPDAPVAPQATSPAAPAVTH